MLGWSGVSDLSCLGEGVLFRSGKLLIYGYGAFFFTPKSREKLYIKKKRGRLDRALYETRLSTPFSSLDPNLFSN